MKTNRNQGATAQKNAEVITAATVPGIGTGIGIRALKTIYINSGDSMIKTLLDQAISGAKALANGQLTIIDDGYDVIQEAIAFLWEYEGKKLNDLANNGEKDKDGNDITILRACFRAVNRYIMKNRQREFKTKYIDDLNDAILAIPFEWDIETIEDYDEVLKTIEKMNLTRRQDQVLNLRMRGKSDKRIAKMLGVSRQAINKTKKQIQEKYNALYPDAKTGSQTLTAIRAGKNKAAYMAINPEVLTDNEKKLIDTYNANNQNITQTAAALGKSRQAIQNALRRLDKKMNS
jgi:DNA-binding CsgD family transcriptional regulator